MNVALVKDLRRAFFSCVIFIFKDIVLFHGIRIIFSLNSNLYIGFVNNVVIFYNIINQKHILIINVIEINEPQK